MTRMTGPDCAAMCNLINTHTHTDVQRTGNSTTDAETKKNPSAVIY